MHEDDALEITLRMLPLGYNSWCVHSLSFLARTKARWREVAERRSIRRQQQRVTDIPAFGGGSNDRISSDDTVARAPGRFDRRVRYERSHVPPNPLPIHARQKADECAAEKPRKAQRALPSSARAAATMQPPVGQADLLDCTAFRENNEGVGRVYTRCPDSRGLTQIPVSLSTLLRHGNAAEIEKETLKSLPSSGVETCAPPALGWSAGLTSLQGEPSHHISKRRESLHRFRLWLCESSGADGQTHGET